MKNYLVLGLTTGTAESQIQLESLMESVSVPQSLMSDEVNLNAKGYEVIGRIVFDRMEQLGYFDPVLELVSL